jgi:hypothetical protein
VRVNATPEVYRAWAALCAATGQLPGNRAAYLEGLARLFPRWLVGRVAAGEPLEVIRGDGGAQEPIPFHREE